MAVAVKEKPKRKVWTYEDYLNLEDEKRYEVINGRLVEMPAPTFIHQDVLMGIAMIIRAFVERKDKGKVLPAPFDVILSETIVVQPDVVFISNENLKNIKRGRLFGPPDLAVEIISPATVRRDTAVKKGIYEKYGVREYWIVYPDERAIEVWVLSDKGKYELFSVAEREGRVKSKVLKGLEVDLKEVLKED